MKVHNDQAKEALKLATKLNELSIDCDLDSSIETQASPTDENAKIITIPDLEDLSDLKGLEDVQMHSAYFNSISNPILVERVLAQGS
jgi:hypothetical protein